ncbi:MAG: MBL fold metallo-hydrolase [Elusimicrobiaceae bacterium]
MPSDISKSVHWHGHSTFRIETAAKTVIYIDPWHISPDNPKADIVLVTHEHHDHCSPDDIARIAKPDTVIAGPAQLKKHLTQKITVLRFGVTETIRDITVEPVPSYNITKPFHPRANGNMGYIITFDGVRLYHAGDTDLIPEMENLRADIALLPVGGTYTMNPAEAALAAGLIKPSAAVPMHCGKHVGSYEMAAEFAKLTPRAVILKEEK